MKTKLEHGTINDFLAATKDMKRCKTMHNSHMYAAADGKTFIELIGTDHDEYLWRTKHVKVGKSVINSGYHMIRTRRGHRLPHRLVAEAWLLPNTETFDNFEVDHINGNKTDNHVTNLEIVSHSENMLRAWRNNQLANPTNKGRYIKKTNTFIHPDGKRVKMTPKEYVDYRKAHNLPVKGWMVAYKED